MTHQEAGRKGGLIGGKTRAKAFTTEYQRSAGKARAAGADMAAVGMKGFVATVRKYGYRTWLEHSQQRRLAKPSELEQKVAVILDRLGVRYEREWMVLTDTEKPLLVDFAFEPDCIVEVHGRPHTVPELNGGNPDGRRARDEARFRRLREAGYRVCVIDHRLMDRAEEDLRTFLAM